MEKREIKDTLKSLSYNLYYSWNKKNLNLFKSVNYTMWEESNHNPIIFLKKIDENELVQKIDENEFLSIKKEYEEYISRKSEWINEQVYKNKVIAYFSAEYGLHKSLEIYSGGLGILSGDHCKSASDLGLKFVAVGLLYREGYFTQTIDSNGNQISEFKPVNPDILPIEKVKDTYGSDLIIQLEFPENNIYAKVWSITVGKVKIYLLDTDIPDNSDEDRNITHKLYAGAKGSELRIKQEIILGIGGVRVLRKLNINPSAWHINEGHSAFLIFELIREEMKQNKLSFNDAINKVRKHILFTTHTPVNDGHESFPINMMKKYFEWYAKELNLSFNKIFRLGNFDDTKIMKEFIMTIFALKLSQYSNGVSKLNREVSIKMWEKVGNSIDYVTNGIHHPTWVAEEFDNLFSKYISKNWKENVDDKKMWENIYEIPDKEIWNIHLNLKKRLIDFVKQHIKKIYLRNKVNNAIIEKILTNLNENKLTIGFARRFAPYKRATLIFKDENRLDEILLNKEKPVQIIFAGKAHPADKEGQKLVKTIYKYSLKEKYLGKIILLENYDMNIASYLVQGSDVWLNNPRKPYEASGTSGQKAAINGALNFSVLDGWWPEAYNQKNGWAIESDINEKSKEKQDKDDSQNLYQTLINEIIPLYYKQENNVPYEWVKMMKESILTTLPLFNTHRMVKEYCTKFYFKLMENE